MVVPRRLALMPLLALALVPVGAAAATSKKPSMKGYVVPCLKADGQTLAFAAKPKSCVAADETTQERSLVPVTKIKWTMWTATRAKATGSVKGEGYSGKVVVTVTKPKRCSARRVVFTQLVVAIKLDEGIGPIARLDVACPK